jgi:hypothetical protein
MLTGSEPAQSKKELTDLQMFYRTKGNPPPEIKDGCTFCNNPFGKSFAKKKNR